MLITNTFHAKPAHAPAGLASWKSNKDRWEIIDVGRTFIHIAVALTVLNSDQPDVHPIAASSGYRADNQAASHALSGFRTRTWCNRGLRPALNRARM